ncbi:hypothetical protein BOTBODRAFT_155984 [Botryobasidium botryosum FD-172 SS1]|uniref:Amino acid permease/ SLC12A domain-containing protein n=1 Tax=Botryobasidium botryosum (strain FD-172 SS1) TaxID=930990 RepID=A0A067MR64_BOTB1|nr:hypothetical protein BOTBODRAFT_155984 [Botryobasidium botryosum FD-172 SS1]
MSAVEHKHNPELSVEEGTRDVDIADIDILNKGGAPIETISPLGYEVGVISGFFLNISQMIGTGVFSTPGSILNSVGSVGFSLIAWVIGTLIAFSGLSLYTELASMFPNRSGAEVVYLEQAYLKPRFLFPTTFAVITVLLSFSATNAIVFAQYVLSAAGQEQTRWNVRGIACGVITFAILTSGLSTKWSLRFVNVVSCVKVITLLFVVVTGWVVLAGGTRITDPHANFRDGFAGTTSNGNGIATALVKVNFAFTGWSNANNVMGEMRDPVKVVKRAGYGALTLVSFLYFFANIAYFAAVPKADIAKSGQLVAALFFRNVFGDRAAVKVLPSLIAISALGNIYAVIIGQARMLREVGRQGVLPFPKLWASSKPFGTPFFPMIVKWVLSIIVTIAPPPGDAFNFLVDLSSYPSLVFAFATTVGVFILRRRRKRQGEPPAPFKAWDILLVFYALVSIFLLIMPWYPPAGGRYGGDVSFWYATYCVVGIGILVVCGLYYWLWIILLPKWRGYVIEEQAVELSDGAWTKVLVRRYHGEASNTDVGASDEGRESPQGEKQKGDSGVVVEAKP